jgi:hypothetical protein
VDRPRVEILQDDLGRARVVAQVQTEEATVLVQIGTAWVEDIRQAVFLFQGCVDEAVSEPLRTVLLRALRRELEPPRRP